MNILKKNPGVLLGLIVTVLFLAIGLTEGMQALEEHEVIECHRMSLTDAVQMVLAGEIVGSKTVCLLLLAAMGAGREHAGQG